MSEVSFQQPTEPEMAEDDTIDAPERPQLNAARPEPYGLNDLIRIMAILRTPVIGCPWDLEQDFGSIAPYTIEEAYEVADAIERGNLADLREELGDLLLQVVFHARMAEEQDSFVFADVVDAICRKLVRRHPHVFGDDEARNAAQVKGLWDRVKAEEVAAKRGTEAARHPESLLDAVPAGLPALTRAVKLQHRAAKIGFDWPDVAPVLSKLKEEIAELEAAMTSGHEAHVREEFGDMLFVLANLARHLKLDPDTALRGANEKFSRRFRHIEARLREDGRPAEAVSLAEMDIWWDEAKAAEKVGN
jgi:nucleoside triphosphate diphosphatase